MADGSGLFLHEPVRAGYRHVGVISNPSSFSRGLDPREAKDWPDIRFAAPRSRGSLLRTLRDYARSGVDLLVVAGGDGTLRDVLSALPLAYTGALPEIALIATGNTNLAARALGLGGERRGALGHLLAAVAAEAGGEAVLRRVPCPVLEIGWTGQPGRPKLRGFFLGSGAYASGKRLADGVVHGHLQQGPAVAVTVLLSVLRGIFGRRARSAGEACAMRVDGRPTLAGRQFVFLATALPRLMFGLWPFRADGAGDVHFVSISAPARRLWATLPALLGGFGSRLLRRNGVQSGRAGRIELTLRQPFVLDGEFFDAGPDGVTVAAGAPVVFVAA
ncbi:hypothetical protein FHR90_001975 [Endobacter medicaginis]|uniref:DAGKc domain-containing protein n=3 Tax=Endobacter medicaginis TaxID=1181271 RepID=A0A839V3N5_9PROT|nr:acylglycerol kinase family protein [Endobacter medicaginis]MBB3174139.1 hypothetical protein [Endobacter medicaginis]MCX5474183.1 acylglycerol kinase family protein [Endobacter medicaginis]